MKSEQIYTDIKNIITKLSKSNFADSKCKDLKSTFALLNDKVDILYKHLQNTEKKAIESSNMKLSFINNIAHEFKTPMNGIRGFSDLLVCPNKTLDKQKVYIDIIRNNCDNLLSLINDTIELSKIQNNTVSISNYTFDIIETTKKIIANYKEEAIKKNLSLTFNNNTGKKNLTITSDCNKIQTIIEHLINNAIKFTDEGGVGVSCEIINNKFNIKVSDTGIGISKEKQENIFDVFAKSDVENANKYNGGNIGLVLINAYIKLMNGDILLESEINKGTNITVSIPISYAKVQKTDKKQQTLEGKNILIVDDEEINFLFLEMILKTTKANMMYAKNGREAIEYCRNDSDIHLILMNIKMPILNGYKATQIIKKFRKDIPIVAQTALDLETEEIKLIESGFDDYLFKPFSADKLLNTIYKYF